MQGIREGLVSLAGVSERALASCAARLDHFGGAALAFAAEVAAF